MNVKVDTSGPFAKLDSQYFKDTELKDDSLLQTGEKEFVSRFIETKIDDQKKANVFYKTKVKGRAVPLSNPTSKKSSNSLRKNRISTTLKRAKPLTAKEKRSSGVYQLPKECQKYELFKPLNHLWTQYIEDLVQTQQPEAVAQKLLKADLHGSVLSVIRSKNPTLIGKVGIVAQETKNCFNIITKDDKMLSMPKINSVFNIKVNKECYNLFGNQFQLRPIERAIKKFKSRNSIEL